MYHDVINEILHLSFITSWHARLPNSEGANTYLQPEARSWMASWQSAVQISKSDGGEGICFAESFIAAKIIGEDNNLTSQFIALSTLVKSDELIIYK